MKRFLYFIPGLTGCATRESILQCVPTLAYAFPPGMPAQGFPVAVGPDGKAGQVCWVGDGGVCKYEPQHQEWQMMGEADAPWLGYAKDRADLPGPYDLISSKAVKQSVSVLLGDGKNWMVPVVRFVNGDTSLPCVIQVKPNGHVKRVPLPEFSDLVVMADEIFYGEVMGAAEYEPADLMRLASISLGINYRVGPFEISVLQLITDQNIVQLAGALLDASGLKKLMDELRKKKELWASGPALETGAPV